MCFANQCSFQVSHLHALTAASTVDDFAYANADISVRVGSSTTQSGGLLKAVENITLHPEYDEGVPNNNDIAVIRFRFRLAFGERIRAIPIAVWTGQGLPANSAFLLTGWLSPDGEEETEDLSESMQLVELRLVERAACSSVHGNVEEGETGAGQPRISQNMFCAVHFENGGNAACSVCFYVNFYLMECNFSNVGSVFLCYRVPAAAQLCLCRRMSPLWWVSPHGSPVAVQIPHQVSTPLSADISHGFSRLLALAHNNTSSIES